MIFDEDILTRLLGSIDANHLVFLCGAGLSIPSPSEFNVGSQRLSGVL
jgi:hypothetical protein